MEHLLIKKGSCLVQYGLNGSIDTTLESFITNYDENGKFDIVFGNPKPAPRFSPRSKRFIANIYEIPAVLKVTQLNEGTPNLLMSVTSLNPSESLLEDIVTVCEIQISEPSEGLLLYVSEEKNSFDQRDLALLKQPTTKMREDTFKYYLMVEKY